MNSQASVILCKLPAVDPALVQHLLALPSGLAVESIQSAFDQLPEMSDELVLTDPESSGKAFDDLLRNLVAHLYLSCDISIGTLDEGEFELTAEQSDRWDELSAEIVQPRPDLKRV